MAGRLHLTLAAIGLSATLAACGGGQPAAHRPGATGGRAQRPSASRGGAAPGASPQTSRTAGGRSTRLARPAALEPFVARSGGRQGVWRAAGRTVAGVPAVYETTLVAPGGSHPAAIAWMDTGLLTARLYSGSRSPGRGPFRYTAPVAPSSARRLVAAFNGGFMMKAARGGYYTERRTVYPLRPGAASLVIYASGAVDVGAWGSDVRMAPDVVAVRQNLLPLVAGGRPTPLALSARWQAWGSTCGAHSCAHSVPGIEHQWRSGVGVTGDGALIYAQGPALDPRQLAELLVRAGAIRAMQLDINPDWPIFATYAPASPRGLAAPANGRTLAATVRGPDTFFESWWARDFITMSAR